MGVSGSGKTTIGKCLSKKLSVPFFDADDYHSKENIRKMRSAVALNDEDRLPWLYSLKKNIFNWGDISGGVLACSALKQSYRNILSDGNDVMFIFLEGDYDLISRRIGSRNNHYFHKKLLRSQFESLENPKSCITVSVDQSINKVCDSILSQLMMYEG